MVFAFYEDTECDSNWGKLQPPQFSLILFVCGDCVGVVVLIHNAVLRFAIFFLSLLLLLVVLVLLFLFYYCLVLVPAVAVAVVIADAAVGIVVLLLLLMLLVLLSIKMAFCLHLS